MEQNKIKRKQNPKENQKKTKTMAYKILGRKQIKGKKGEKVKSSGQHIKV